MPHVVLMTLKANHLQLNNELVYHPFSQLTWLSTFGVPEFLRRQASLYRGKRLPFCTYPFFINDSNFSKPGAMYSVKSVLRGENAMIGQSPSRPLA